MLGSSTGEEIGKKAKLNKKLIRQKQKQRKPDHQESAAWKFPQNNIHPLISYSFKSGKTRGLEDSS